MCPNTERSAPAGIGLLILDECHHLMGHWGRVLSEVREYLGDPIVVGLTATPPDREGRQSEDIERYDRFFGPVDFEVPVPAVVKDGYFAPYQDLAYFVRPTERELEFIARVDHQFDRLVEDLCHGDEETEDDGPADDGAEPTGAGQRAQNQRATERQSLTEWLGHVLTEHSLPGRSRIELAPFLLARSESGRSSRMVLTLSRLAGSLRRGGPFWSQPGSSGVIGDADRSIHTALSASKSRPS